MGTRGCLWGNNRYYIFEIMPNKIIDIIKERIEQNNIDATFLNAFFNEHLRAPIYMPIVLTTEAHIIRMRKNKNDLFNNVSDVTYPPADYSRNDRANLQGDPMFYGVLIDSPTDIPDIMSSILESSPGIFNLDNFGEGIVTESTWAINENFYLYALPVKEGFNIHPLSQIIYERWNEKKHKFPHEDVKIIEYMGELMSQKGDETIYKVTACFVKHILSTHPDLKGIIYPSVQSQGEGICVAINPNVVDDMMQCIKTQMLYYSKQDEKSAEVRTVAISSVGDNGFFHWEYKEGWSESMVKEIISRNN